MSRVRVHNFSISLDGFGTGDRQTLEAPFGHAGTRLHEWFFPTRTFRGFHDTQGEPAGTTGVDDAFASNWATDIGVEIMGRNKFGPQRGPWTDEDWQGWWGEDPPFHTPVYILTHHQRPPIQMEGGTTFHFVTEGFDAAYAAAREAAGDKGVDIAGGASTVRQALNAGVIDELTLDIAPVLLGSGERMFDGVESFGFEPVEVLHSPLTTHIRYRRVG